MVKKSKTIPTTIAEKRITVAEVLLFVIVGYLIVSIFQAIFCGTQSVNVCSKGLWVIPVWIILGIIYFVYKKQ
ncbi:MAG: hypothetical protein QW041_03455 [Candidatus Pacearchaeota archaeon]